MKQKAPLSRSAIMDAGAQALTIGQVAALLQIGKRKVTTFILRGELRAANLSLGGKKPRYRIMPGDLESFLTSRAGSARTQTTLKPRKRRF